MTPYFACVRVHLMIQEVCVCCLVTGEKIAGPNIAYASLVLPFIDQDKWSASVTWLFQVLFTVYMQERKTLLKGSSIPVILQITSTA